MHQTVRKPALPSWFPTLAVGVGVAGALLAGLGALGGRLPKASFRLKAPELQLLAGQSPFILVHLAAALTALLVGLVIFSQRKGSRFHKTLGWSWVVLMAVTAVSSFFIHELNRHGYSPIHLLSGWTVIALPMAIFAVRTRRIPMHQRTMTGLFVGGLIIAGALTFLPGRLMWRIFFG